MALPLISLATGYSTAIADRPTAANAATGRIWYDTGLDMAQPSDGSNWKSEFNRAPTVTTAASTEIASISAFTSFSQTHTVAANSMTVGRVIRVYACGVYSTDAAAGPDMGWRLVFGSGPTSVMEPPIPSGGVANQTNEHWELAANLVFRSIGAGGTVHASGYWRISTTVGALSHLGDSGPNSFYDPNTSTTAWDTTAAQALAVQGYFGTSDADNKMTMHQFIVEYLGGS